MGKETLADDLEKLQIWRGDGDGKKKKSSGRKIKVIILGAVFLGCVLALVYYYRSEALGDANRNINGVQVTSPQLAAPPQGAQSLTAAGYIVPKKKVELGSKIMGRLAHLGVEEGDVVARGQVIARLEDNEIRAQLRQAEAALQLAQAKYAEISAGSRPEEIEQQRASLEQAEANLKAAKANLERFRKLYEKEIVSVQELETVQNQHQVRLAEYKGAQEKLKLLAAGPRPETLSIARAEIQQAQAQVEFYRTLLENTVIRSPITGVVVEKLAEVGEIVSPNTAAEVSRSGIVTIASFADMRAEVDVNESDLVKLRLNQAADIVLDGLPDRTYRGLLAKIHPQANRQKGAFKIEVAVLDPDDKLRPEMSAKVVFKQVDPLTDSQPEQR